MDNLTKSLTDLIDETLLELEELKKSRFSAAEIEIKGPGEGIDGKPTNGKLDAAKAEDDKEDEDEEEAKKADDSDDKEDKKDDEKEEGSPKHEAKEKEAIKDLANMHDMKKSQVETETLLKSYIDGRIAPLEQKLSTIVDLVTKMADQPVAPRGATARTTPLLKSADEGAVEPLTKSQVASKLLDLKKSNHASVDSLDIVKAEMGQELGNLVSKYKLS